MNVLVLLIPIILFTNSCTSKAKDITPIKKIETVTTPVKKIPLNLDHPSVIELDKINWIIITKDNAAETFDVLTTKDTDAVLFGLTDDNYEILSKKILKNNGIKKGKILDFEYTSKKIKDAIKGVEKVQYK